MIPGNIINVSQTVSSKIPKNEIPIITFLEKLSMGMHLVILKQMSCVFLFRHAKFDMAFYIA